MAATKRRYVAIFVALLLIVGIPRYLTMGPSPDPDQSAIWPPATVPADIPPVEGPAAEASITEYLSGCPSAAEMQVQDTDAREVTLEFAMSAPEDSWFVQRLREAAALVKDQTAGRVSIKIYPGGIMGSDRKATMKVMSRGNFLQGAVVSSASLADTAPELGIYGIPMLFRSPDEVTHLRKNLDPLLRDALQEWCLVSFGFAGNGFTHLFSQLPVQTGQDLNGKSVWIPLLDNFFYRFIEGLSVTPSLLDNIDVTVSLQTQLLDVVPASPLTVLLLQWHDHLDYVTDLPLSYSYNVLVINAGTFRKIAPMDQQVLAATLNAAMLEFDTAGFASSREALRTLTERGHVRLVPADPAFQARLEARARETTMKMIAYGVLPKDLTLQALQILEDYRAAAP